MSCEFCNKKARVTLPIVDTEGMRVCQDHALVLHPIMAIHSGCQCEHCGCSCRGKSGCSFRRCGNGAIFDPPKPRARCIGLGFAKDRRNSMGGFVERTRAIEVCALGGPS